MVSHWPFRNWCEHCVRGKARAGPHRTTTQKSEIPIVGIDFMWMTSEEDKREYGYQREMPILVSADEKTGWLGAWVIPEKGEHWHAVRMLVGSLEELGYNQVIVRSDQEPAIVKLKSAVKREITREVICKESPVGDSQSLGSVNIQVQCI